MQIVADRFAVDDRGCAIDLASGEGVRLVWSSAGGASEQARWVSRCAWFAALHHPVVARLVDYGACGETRRVEAWRAWGPWHGTDEAAQQAVAGANRFLAALSLTPAAGLACAASLAARAVIVPDDAAGYAVATSNASPTPQAVLPADLLGVVREHDRQVASIADALLCGSGSHPLAMSIWDAQRSGVASAADVLARAARLAGLVPVCTRMLTPEIRALVAGRTLLVLALDDAEDGWRALLRATIESPLRHMVLFASAESVPRVHTVPLRRVPEEQLVGSVVPRPTGAALVRHVADAARRARGRPCVFEDLLWGRGGGVDVRATQPARRAAEPAVAFGAAVHQDAPPPPNAAQGPRAWPAHGELLRFRRQLELACAQLGRGRLASGERTARQAAAALARRGDWVHAAGGAIALARSLARHGRTGDAERVLGEARAWAAEAGDTGLLREVATLIGRVLTDAGRLSDAHAVLDAAAAAAAAADAPDRVASARALARCLYWQGRYDEAWQQLADHASGPLPAREAILVAAMRSRIAIGRGQVTDAIAEAACARDAARGMNAPELLASSCYAWSLAQLAAGDCTRADEAAAEALGAARRARRPLLSLCARLLRAEIARRQGSARCASALVARLSRVPSSRLPPIVRARADLLRDACAATDVAEVARRRAEATGLHALSLLVPSAARHRARVAADAIAELLQCCQAADEDVAVLTAVCVRLRARLRAATVAFFAPDRGQFVQIAGDGARTDPAIAARVHTAGQLVLPHLGGERIDAGVPVRYAGRLVGVLAVRWPPAGTWDSDEVAMLLSTGAAAAGPAVSGAIARREAAATPRGADLLGVSAAMRDVRTAVELAAGAPFPVLVAGESGTGKELVAQLVHRLGPRRDRHCCALNCAALPDDLAESELFGHARGSFTGAHGDRPGVFEEAHGGTLFLDEIGELSMRAQAKVLRAIQEGEVRRVGENTCRRVDVRLVAATNRDLRAEVAGGRFRLDLLYRLDVIRIVLPPLRERRDDIVVLAEHFWHDAAQRVGSRATLSTAALATLARYDWPGNVRELQNVLASVAVRSPRRGVVLPSALPPHLGEAAERPLRLDAARRAFDRRFIREALSRAGGHRARAADELGVTRQGLAKLMARLRVDDAKPDVEGTAG